MAEPICRQTLLPQEEALGKEHPSTLTSMNNVAGLLENQGKYDKAESICWQALLLQQKFLGKGAPLYASEHEQLRGPAPGEGPGRGAP